MLNIKSSNILEYIINGNGWISQDELSKNFLVSKRTIRYELAKIDEFLNDNNFPLLDRSKTKGVKYLNNEVVNIITSKKASYDNRDYILSKEERVSYLVYTLLNAKGYSTIDELKDDIDVSRGTVVNDLKKVREQIEKCGLKLISTPKHGLIVEGNEADKRKASLIYLRKTMLKEHSLEYVKEVFSDIDIEPVRDYVEKLETELDLEFVDESYINLILHILLAIKRIQIGKDILFPKDELDKLYKCNEFHIANKLIHILELKYEVKIPLDEVGYITIRILSSKNTKLAINSKVAEMEFIVRKFLINASNDFNVNFIKDDQLFNNLVTHLTSAFYRIEHNIILENPILDEIKDKYRDIFYLLNNSIKILESFGNKSFNEHEIGYITLHIKASLVKLENKRSWRKVLLVCGTGYGTATLLENKLLKLYDIEVVGSTSVRKAKDYLKEDIDVIITTVDLNFQLLNEIPIIKVNALLNSKDLEILSKHLYPITKKNIDLDKLINVIKENCNIKNFQGLCNGLQEIFYEEEIKRRMFEPMLKELLTENYIELGVEAANWEDAVRKGGSLLENNGNVTNQYVEGMVEAVKTLGPYIVIAPHIAMPHARPELGVNKIGFSLITLKDEVDFGGTEHNPVKIVISICAVDHVSHIKALSNLVEYLRRDEFIELLYKANDKNEVLKYIQESKEI